MICFIMACACVFVRIRASLTYTCTTQILADTDRANNNSLTAQISNLPGFDASKARFVKQYRGGESGDSSAAAKVDICVPTAAELMLPWRRDLSHQSLGTCYIPTGLAAVA